MRRDRGNHRADSRFDCRDPPDRVGEDRHQAGNLAAAASREEPDDRPGGYFVARAEGRPVIGRDLGFQPGMTDEGAVEPFGLE